MGPAGRLGRAEPRAAGSTGRLGSASSTSTGCLAQQQQGQQGGYPQQGQQGGWGQQAAPQQDAWAQQQQGQQGGWGQQAQPAQQGGWGQQAAPQQDACAQQQQGQQGGWGQQAAPQQDAWAQQQQGQQGGWGQQAQPQQQGGWGQPAQQGSGGNWGQQAQAQVAQQSPANAWNAPAQPQPASAPGWGQPQQGFGGGSFDGPESDRTVLRGGQAGGTGMAMGGVAAGRMGMVRIEEGKEPGRVYEVRKEALSIGRSRESDIFLEDLAVSRLHASIISQGNGNYALRDEGSANGTKVNGQQVNKYQPYPLQDGDKIQLGQTVLVFGRR